MLNLEVKTKLSAEEVAKLAKGFFGKKGLGLEVIDENPELLCFEGGGGYVTATICAEKGETRVALVTQEWEYQVKEFTSKLS